MKILYLCLNSMMSTDDNSGYATHMREVIDEFGNAGHDVKILTGRVGSDSRIHNACYGFLKKLMPKRIRATIRDVLEIQCNRKLLNLVKKTIEDFHPDAIYERASSFVDVGSYLATQHSIPYFLELNAPLDEEHKRLTGSLISHCDRKYMKRNLTRALKVFVVSETLRNWVLGEFRVQSERVVVIPNGVNKTLFNAERYNSAKTREELMLTNKIVVGYLGSSLPHHGLDFLLLAMDQLSKKFSNVALLAIISGLGNKKMKDCFINRKYCVLLEEQNYQNVPKYLNVMDICLVADSTWYCSPIKLFEYGAMGKAVVAVRKPPIEGIITDGVNGELFDGRDSHGFVHKIETYIRDENARLKAGMMLRAQILNDFTWEKACKKILSEIATAKLSHILKE